MRRKETHAAARMSGDVVRHARKDFRTRHSCAHPFLDFLVTRSLAGVLSQPPDHTAAQGASLYGWSSVAATYPYIRPARSWQWTEEWVGQLARSINIPFESPAASIDRARHSAHRIPGSGSPHLHGRYSSLGDLIDHDCWKSVIGTIVFGQ